MPNDGGTLLTPHLLPSRCRSPGTPPSHPLFPRCWEPLEVAAGCGVAAPSRRRGQQREHSSGFAGEAPGLPALPRGFASSRETARRAQLA